MSQLDQILPPSESDAPPLYQPEAGPSSLPPPPQSTSLALRDARALSGFLGIGRVIAFEEFLAFTSGGPLDWDRRSEVPAPGTLVDKHGNLGAWIKGDKEPPLIKLKNIKLTGLQALSRDLAMAIPLSSFLLATAPPGHPAIFVGEGMLLHHPSLALVGPSTRIKIDGVSTSLASPPTAITFPLFAESLYLKPVQWVRGGHPNVISGIRLRVVWAEARTQESYLAEEGFIGRLEEALDRIPRRSP